MLEKVNTPPQTSSRCVKPYDDHVPDFYRVFPCDSPSVLDALEAEVQHWTPRNPTLIAAPTGKGKTTLVYESIIPRAVRHGGNVLLISNRVALSLQQKIRIMEILQSPLIGQLTDKGIRETENFGSVCIITYHRLPGFVKNPKNQEWLKNVMYVVGDETHMICSDVFYNEKCGYYLKLLTQEFQHAVRIYMTATSWDILYPLAAAEASNFSDRQAFLRGWESPREFRLYQFHASYKHVNLLFFDNLKEIRERIESTPDEKWLVFVDSKATGKAFAQELGNQALYLDADSKGSDQWNLLVENSKFTQHVLVTTAVLDCGVNIIDPTLRNVVIITDDRTSLVQMLGRKRCVPGECINLYVYNVDDKKIGDRYKDYKELLQWYDRYGKSSGEERKKMAFEIWHSPNNKLRHYFDLASGYLVPNQIAFFALKRKIKFYEAILEGEITFEEAVREWLAIPAKEKEAPQNVLLRFCESHLGVELSNEEISSFRRLVNAAAKQGGFTEPQPRRLDKLGRDALNHRLTFIDFPYALAKGAWKIQNKGNDNDH